MQAKSPKTTMVGVSDTGHLQKNGGDNTLAYNGHLGAMGLHRGSNSKDGSTS